MQHSDPRVVGEKAQAQLKNFGFVLRFLGQPAEIPARQVEEAGLGEETIHLFTPDNIMSVNV